MGETRKYTLDELVQLSGFDRRTIAYYVQKGVLPKVGRRGPRTRYPQSFLDRLIYVKRLRDMQDTGRLPAVSLNEIRDAFATQTAMEIHRVAQGDEEPEWLGNDDPSMRLTPDPQIDAALADDVDPAHINQLRDLYAVIRKASKSKFTHQGNAPQQWAEVPVTENMRIAFRGLRDEDAEVAAAIGRILRGLLD